jgi:hypothetical protein
MSFTKSTIPPGDSFLDGKYISTYNSNGGMMKTTLNIPDDLIRKAMSLGRHKTKTETVIVAPGICPKEEDREYSGQRWEASI